MLLKMGRGCVPPARHVRRFLSPPTAAPADPASHAHRSACLSYGDQDLVPPKTFSGTKCHNIHVLYHLKRFLGTVCYEHGEWPRPAWRFFGGTPSDAERVVC